jgi:hypothetical protein
MQWQNRQFTSGKWKPAHDVSGGVAERRGRATTEPLRAQRTKGISKMTANVFVVHGANDGEFPFAGHTVLDAKNSLQEAFNISYFAEATINGELVSVDYQLQPGDTLEFTRRFGFKGAGDADRAELEANGLLRAYPGLQKIAEEVKASGKLGPEAIDLTIQRVAEWCRNTFGPPEERNYATLERLVQQLGDNVRELGGHVQAVGEVSNAVKINDGPIPLGELWYKGELFELRLTSLEFRFINALWKSRRQAIESVCEEVYGKDDTDYSGIKDVKKRVNGKFKDGHCPLVVTQRNGFYLLIETNVEGTAADEQQQ